MLFFTGMGGIALSLSGLQGDALSYKKAVMNNAIDGIVLFSGGLDSILASRVLMEQGLSVRCLHFVSPFFGSLHSAERWKRLYGVDVVIADASQPIVDLVNGWPPHGFGKVMNPCVDCKITLLRMARAYMENVGAKFLATGEVVGQRPMSQRCDVMNTIRREAGVDGILLRPLCAHHLDPTPMELSGLVDRSKLLGIHGRGRQEQLALAKEFGFTEIPTPGGGCWLAERENARRYWPIRTRYQGGTVGDYYLAAVGRQFWNFSESPAAWLIIGRNSSDNEKLKRFVREGDLTCGMCDFSGPFVLLRGGTAWGADTLMKALAVAASYSPRAVQAGGAVRVWCKDAGGHQQIYQVVPDVERTGFTRMTWEEVRQEKHELASLHCAEDERLRRERRAAREAGEKAPGMEGKTSSSAEADGE